MIKTEIKNDRLGEKYTVATHESGLKIYVCEKPVFKSTYAIFGTKYGSVDNAFKIKGEKEYKEVPEGIAHYLEHKLFESEDGDAFERYSKTGASANAYTTFDKTCYLFTCSDKFEESFEILLDFVQHPYFTEQTVQKEQGIIGQEISMYDDSPGWIILFNLLKSLYHNNPVKINIAGTHETIAKINADLLYECYNTFYNLNNMFITVAGNVKTERVLELCDKFLKKSEKVEFETKPYGEPDEIVTDYTETKMAVAIPQFAMGFKYSVEGYVECARKVKTDMLLQLMFGKQSEFFNEMIKKGLINSRFDAELFEGRNFASVIFMGESKEPKLVAEKIRETVERYKKDGINQKDFSTVKKLFYGRYVSSFDDVENVGDMLCTIACSGEGLFEEGEVIANITASDLEKVLREEFDVSKCALSVIYPKE